MGDVLNLNQIRFPDGLEPGPAEEMEHIGTIDGMRVSIATQTEAHPGWVHVVVSSEETKGATSVSAVHDTPDGVRLARFVGRAVLRAYDAVQPVPIVAEQNAYPPKGSADV